MKNFLSTVILLIQLVSFPLGGFMMLIGVLGIGCFGMFSVEAAVKSLIILSLGAILARVGSSAYN